MITNKTIEFIKQNIFDCKNHIEHLEIKIIEDEKYSTLVKNHKERIEELKSILNLLQQIKAELEAWEVVKPYIEEGVSFTLSNFLKNNTGKFKTLKKALEVEDANM